MHHFCFLCALLTMMTDEQRYKALQFALVGISALVYCRIKRINTTAKNVKETWLQRFSAYASGWIYTTWCKWPNSDYFLPSGTDWNCNMNESVGKERVKSDIVKLETRIIYIWEYIGYESDICRCVWSLSRQIGQIVSGIVSHWTLLKMQITATYTPVLIRARIFLLCL